MEKNPLIKIHICCDCGKKSEIMCVGELLPNTPCIDCLLIRLNKKKK